MDWRYSLHPAYALNSQESSEFIAWEPLPGRNPESRELRPVSVQFSGLATVRTNAQVALQQRFILWPVSSFYSCSLLVGIEFEKIQRYIPNLNEFGKEMNTEIPRLECFANIFTLEGWWLWLNPFNFSIVSPFHHIFNDPFHKIGHWGWLF
jgi:hypothetical protein